MAFLMISSRLIGVLMMPFALALKYLS